MRLIPFKYLLPGFIAAGACAFFSAGLVTAIQSKGFGSAETAGWVQAIGATVGLCIAIWVPFKQKADTDVAAELSRRETARRLCLVFLNELSLLAATFTRPDMENLLDAASNNIYNGITPTPLHRFPVFTALIGQITQIDDEITRLSIMDAYDAVDSTIEIGGANNIFLREFTDLSREIRENGSTKHAEEMRLREENLRVVGTQLRKAAQASVVKTLHAIKQLERTIASYD